MSDTVSSRLESIRESFPKDRTVTLVAVSKFQPDELILEAYEAGQRDFGESRVQELESKSRSLPSDIRWHFIGHLQTNKVAQLLKINGLHLIQSVDSFRLLELIDREAYKAGITARILLEVHVAQEETKFGFSPEELIDWFRNGGFESLKAVHICGIMGMASNTDNLQRITEDFRKLHDCYETILNISPELRGFDILSMGMSGDYLEAIREGSNMVRIGSSIFGERNY